MTNRAEFERLLDVYGFRCERFGQDLSTHARAQVVSAFAALASAPVAREAQQPLGYVAVLHAPCSARYFSRITDQHQARICADQWAKQYADVKPGPWTTEAVAVYAAPQASEAVRDAALEEAARLIETTRETTTIEPGGDTQRHLTPRKTPDLTGATWAEGIRALKTQADKDGGDCAKGAGDEPIAWESTTPVYFKFITDSRYRKFSPAVRKWYRPYRCSTCAALSPTQPAEQGERDE